MLWPQGLLRRAGGVTSSAGERLFLETEEWTCRHGLS